MVIQTVYLHRPYVYNTLSLPIESLMGKKKNPKTCCLCRYFKLKRCVSRLSSVGGKLAVGEIPKWPLRLTKSPSRAGGKNGNEEFESDTRIWEKRMLYYKKTLNLKIGSEAVRNVMDMDAYFGGFAAALISDPVWVMNVVPHNKPSTLGVIFDRGLIGVYHDWSV